MNQRGRFSLRSQSGQWQVGLGAFLHGFATARERAQEQARQREEMDLRKKMIDAQIKQIDLSTQLKQHEANAIAELIKGGPTVETQVSPADQDVSEMAGGAPTPAGTTLQRQAPIPQQQLESIQARLAPHQYVAGKLRQQMMNATQVFATPEEALAFQNTPEYKALYPFGSRVVQSQHGFVHQGINPVNIGSSVYHNVLQATGDPQKALAAANAYQFQQGASGAAGTVAGTAAQTLGQPIQPMMPSQQGSAGPGPLSQVSPALQAAQAKSAATERGHLDVQKTPEYLQSAGEISARKSAGQHAGQGLQGLVAATAALKALDQTAELLKKNNASLVGAIGATAGAAPGLKGRIARSMNAPEIGADLNAAQLPVIQHYESMYAGVRGAASPQILEMMTAKMITPSDEPSLIEAKLRYFHNVFEALSRGLQRGLKGQTVSESDLEAVIARPVGGAAKATEPPPPPGWSYKGQ